MASRSLSTTVFPNENFLDLQLIQCGMEQCAPLHSFGSFVRNNFLFHFIISGKGCLNSSGPDGTPTHYTLEAGQGFLICPGQVNTYNADKYDPWKYVWLEFGRLRAEEHLDYAGLNMSQPVYRPKSPAQAESVRDAMLYIVDHHNAPAPHLIGHLWLFLDALIQSSAAQRNVLGNRLQSFYIQEAVTFMEEDFRREIAVEELAGMCGLNRSYFSKLFRESMGCPPQEFLIRLRLSKAAEQMQNTNASIGDISASCGYTNQLYFSRAFKKRYGLSPREWRSQNKSHAVNSQT